MAECLARAGAAAEPAIPSLLPLLADRSRQVCAAAEAALEEIGPEAVPALIELVRARDVQRLRTWAESLDRFSPRCTALASDVIVERRWEYWKNVLWTAYDIMEEHARLEIAQEAALEILGKLGPAASAAVPTVTMALVDPNPAIRSAAARTLGQMGAAARSAIPALMRAVYNPHSLVQAEAAQALSRIEEQVAASRASSDRSCTNDHENTAAADE
jgi:HEAT repeat protein